MRPHAVTETYSSRTRRCRFNSSTSLLILVRVSRCLKKSVLMTVCSILHNCHNDVRVLTVIVDRAPILSTTIKDSSRDSPTMHPPTATLCKYELLHRNVHHREGETTVRYLRTRSLKPRGRHLRHLAPLRTGDWQHQMVVVRAQASKQGMGKVAAGHSTARMSARA